MSSFSSCNIDGPAFPINRLPPEVIAQVFKHCLPKPGIFEESLNDVAPLLPGRVCSSWRALAHSTPELWNMLNLYIGRGGRDVPQDITGFMTAWLEKSGKLPLIIFFRLGLRVSKTFFNSIFECLYRYSSRWEILDVALVEMQRTALPPMGDLPLLQSFRYSDWQYGGHFGFPFASAPCLTRLDWPYGHRVVEHTGVPWHKLTHLSFNERITPCEVLETIHSCPELLEFSAVVNGEEMEERSLTRHRVELRKLRKFHVTLHLYCSPLLRSLTLPQLVDVSLTIDYEYGYRDRHIHSELLQLFTRSKCKLDRLYLEDCGFDENMTLECFRHNSLSTLTELHVEGWSDPLILTDRIILELTLTEDTEEGLLPNLSRLSLYYYIPMSPGLLGWMVFSGRRSLEWRPGQLKFFSLTTPSLRKEDRTYIDMASVFGLEVDFDIDDSSTSSEHEIDSDGSESLSDSE
ncbi:hypothetical protein AX17_002609 [Amanita inopinata Kibby_2008]|nr:hypothetical protein AX17_002609 [Amanita inopinata Kibby_2008]